MQLHVVHDQLQIAGFIKLWLIFILNKYGITYKGDFISLYCYTLNITSIATLAMIFFFHSLKLFCHLCLIIGSINVHWDYLLQVSCISFYLSGAPV